MKVSLLNPKLLKLYGSIIAVLSTIVSFVQIFYELPEDCQIKTNVAICFVISLVVIYIAVLVYSNKTRKVELEINGTKIRVITGDIFKQTGLKIIPFNEYFDTLVDDKLISSNTLHGKYILNYIDDINRLDNRIINDNRLRGLQTFVDNKRSYGKRIKYPLGTIYKNDDYLLLAFSKFDSDNRAYLDKIDIIKCLLNMWNEIDILYSGCSINIPLLGTGITRFHGVKLSEQELLEILLISFKLSGLTLMKNTTISIIIHRDSIDNINFFKLSEFL